MDDPARMALDIAASIKPLLAGYQPSVQGSALAELVSLWLAGHHIAGDDIATSQLRDELLTEWIEAVRQMTKFSAEELHTGGNMAGSA